MTNVFMKKITLLKLCFVSAVIVFVPHQSFAARVYLESTRSTVSVGDVVIVNVKIDSEGESINSIDGAIGISSRDTIEVHDFSLAGSLFTVWPRTPSLSRDKNAISFVGGVPGGRTTDSATVFSIALEAMNQGKVTLSPLDMSLFANDGQGTRIAVVAQDFSIEVLPKGVNTTDTDDWLRVVASDKKPPESFVIEVGRESTVFDGKRFASFSSIDNESGISHYEVSEDGAAAVRSGGTYVLQNQDDTQTPLLVVTAYDKAGNKKSVTYRSTESISFPFSPQFIILGVVIVIVLFFYRKTRNKKNAQRQSNIS